MSERPYAHFTENHCTSRTSPESNYRGRRAPAVPLPSTGLKLEGVLVPLLGRENKELQRKLVIIKLHKKEEKRVTDHLCSEEEQASGCLVS